jgi:hypothetical protein
MTVILLCWMLASHIAIQPLDKEKAQQQATADNSQAQGKINPSNAVPPSQLSSDKKPADNKSHTDHHAWDWHKAVAPEYLSNWALVIVGLGATVAALVTLGVISRQAKSMRYQTRILRRSADSQIASERAWLVAELVPTAMFHHGRRLVPYEGYTGELSENDLSDCSQFEYTLKVKNVGKTPAFLMEYRINRSNGLDDEELIDFDYPYRYLGAGEQLYLKAFNIPSLVAKCPAHSRVLFFGHVFYQHVFSETETVKDGFARLFQRNTGRLLRMPMPEEKSTEGNSKKTN